MIITEAELVPVDWVRGCLEYATSSVRSPGTLVVEKKRQILLKSQTSFGSCWPFETIRLFLVSSPLLYHRWSRVGTGSSTMKTISCVHRRRHRLLLTSSQSHNNTHEPSSTGQSTTSNLSLQGKVTNLHRRSLTFCANLLCRHIISSLCVLSSSVDLAINPETDIYQGA